MNAKHTPGDYRAEERGNTFHYWVVTHKGKTICLISAGPNQREIAERIAHERNCHADLLAALEAIVRAWRDQGGRVFESMGSDNPRALAIDETIGSARAAIAKATT